jgi:hypothetical protein
MRRTMPVERADRICCLPSPTQWSGRLDERLRSYLSTEEAEIPRLRMQGGKCGGSSMLDGVQVCGGVFERSFKRYSGLSISSIVSVHKNPGQLHLSLSNKSIVQNRTKSDSEQTILGCSHGLACQSDHAQIANPSRPETVSIAPASKSSCRSVHNSSGEYRTLQ